MNDLRTRLPECPLEYQVPHIPASHTALVIEINAADIEWQEKMLPWTLAGLINNTDIVMKGVHLYIACEDGNLQRRIRTALKRIDLPPGTLITKDAESNQPLILFGHYGHRYDSVCILDVNYWAFRGIGKRQDASDIKLPFGHVLRHTWGWAVADVSLHHENDMDVKDTWVRMSSVGRASAGFQPAEGNGLRADSLANPRPTDEPLHLTGGDSPEHRQKLSENRGSATSGRTLPSAGSPQASPDARFSEAKHLIGAAERAKWLHAANCAVHGEDYEKKDQNVAAYFFNETEANWHLDASLLHYSAAEVNTPYFAEWAPEWQHLGTEALIALWLLKTKQHAYNLQNSVMIASNYTRSQYPRLCNMEFADAKQFSYAAKELLGAQLNIAMN